MIKAYVKEWDNTQALAAKLRAVADMRVYVGIPEEKAGRKSGDVNNAQLMYIHTNGSPLKGIPARPVIEPAIKASGNREQISEEMGASARALMNGNPTEASRHLNFAGMAGQNAARDWFEDPRNGWALNSKETAKRKMFKIKGQALQDFNRKISEGGAITDADISRPLIDTGQLRKSIIFVVKE